MQEIPLQFSLRKMLMLLSVLCCASLPTALFADEIPSTGAGAQSLPLWQAIALGLIEGATEFLPVSSTGHLLIFGRWLGNESSADSKEAADALAICIQIGAILAVVLLYFHRLKQIVSGLLGGDRDGRRLAINLVVAFVPAAVCGLLFGKLIKQQLFGIRPVTIAMFVGGLIILAIPRTKSGDELAGTGEMHDLKWWKALLIGTMQCLALWPGFSRSLATILGCRLAGLRMAAAVEFSFLLGLITLSAATAKEGIDHGSKIIEIFGVTSPAVALIVAFVAAMLSVRFMVGLLNRFGLAPFGYYRILLAVLCLLLW